MKRYFCVKVELEKRRERADTGTEKAKVGRKKKYETAQQLANAVNKYFNSITYEETVKDKEGNPVTTLAGSPLTYVEYGQPPSIQALCIFLKIDTSTWENYSKDEVLSDVCAAAKLRIEAYLVGQINTRDRPQGIMFNLENNFGWKKKKEVDIGEKTAAAVSAASLPMEEKKKILKEVASMSLALYDDDKEEFDNADVNLA